MTIHSHTKFGELGRDYTEVMEGKHVWHRKDCVDSSTLLGEGAYFAPESDKIAHTPAAQSLRQFLRDPSVLLRRADTASEMPKFEPLGGAE